MCSNAHKAYYLKLLIQEIREAIARPKPRSGGTVPATGEGSHLPRPQSFKDPVPAGNYPPRTGTGATAVPSTPTPGPVTGTIWP